MLSIVIPVYNSSDTLRETFNSALKSGVEHQEIIFVDDASTDNSREILIELQSTNKNVKCIFNEKNLGGGGARNIGIKHANHSLIFVLDSDDILVENALPKAILEMQIHNADAIATSASKMFVSKTDKILRESHYQVGFSEFQSLVTHSPSPIIGNLLFTKEAYLKAGGYPEHHGFDTQAFGFRLMSNRLRVYIGSTFLYYQRVPSKPSYFVRESKSGNINKNWFYIFIECLYKFSPHVRRAILDFPYDDPYMLAKGKHLFNFLADTSNLPEFFSSDGLCISDVEAYERYCQVEDITLSIWCLTYELRYSLYENAFSRLKKLLLERQDIKILFPFFSQLMGGRLSAEQIKEFTYFFAKDKSLEWRCKTLLQRLINRLSMGIFL